MGLATKGLTVRLEGGFLAIDYNMADAFSDAISSISDICMLDLCVRTSLADLIFQILPTNMTRELFCVSFVTARPLPQRTFCMKSP